MWTAQLGFRQILQNGLSLEDAAELAVGAIKPILAAEGHQPLKGDRRHNVSCLKRCVELAHAIPLLGDQVDVAFSR